ncbi:dTMP kinase [Sedimentibacter sp. MB31-C6]|uniref:dTMP kinase n=1 Tax=Sedimentibacter sp. MB31-C6 TaxID=3109366 RepID=UPI002DDD0DFA|nr:dTMP kinase [Sedimentibacter sp. MB36-C1]WSI04354.1 dTMP kinase [Sedimentibacter sp. MB36-C1]
MKGLFIVLEGPDGSGKSTMAKKIGEYFKEQGREIEFTREPGGTNISEKIRELILDNNNIEMNYRTEALLYAAARAQLVSQKIIPWLEAGKIVISERYVYSSLVYQGLGRGLGIDEINKINNFGTTGLKPDLVLLFDINPERALKRKLSIDGGDRMEKENISFHKEVYAGYKTLTKSYPEIKTINAERTIDEIFNDIKKIINLKKEETI